MEPGKEHCKEKETYIKLTNDIECSRPSFLILFVECLAINSTRQVHKKHQRRSGPVMKLRAKDGSISTWNFTIIKFHLLYPARNKYSRRSMAITIITYKLLSCYAPCFPFYSLSLSLRCIRAQAHTDHSFLAWLTCSSGLWIIKMGHNGPTVSPPK